VVRQGFFSLLLTLGFLAGCATARTTLSDNRRTWQDQRISNYDYVLRVGCFCGYVGDYRVSVRNNEVHGVTFLPTGESLPARDGGFFRTIDGLFDRIGVALAEAERVIVEYHSPLGYPVRVFIDRRRSRRDDELTLEVEIARAAEGARDNE
jgi:hypothetical protein